MSTEFLVDSQANEPQLIDFIRKVVTRMDNVTARLESVTADFEDRLKSYKNETDAKIEELTSSVSHVSSLYDEQVKINGDLLQRIVALEEANVQHYSHNDQIEQYSRRNCLLIHGLQENTQEDTTEDTTHVAISKINELMNTNLEEKDICRSHRLGLRKKGSNAKPRPIIIKFTRYSVRAGVFSQKKKLKGKDVLITESLTRRRVEVLRQVRDKYGHRKVWTQDGEIFREGNKKGDKIHIQL